MRKLIVFLLLIYSSSFAQKIAYVDSKYILENIPEFTTAQDELNTVSQEYQKEIDDLKDEVEKMYRAYQAEQYLLPKDKKREREELIILKEKDVQSLTKKRFGPNGDFYDKQEQLVRPIQDLIYKAIQDFAQEAKYDIIFDKSSDLIMLFSDSELDKSDNILEKLGY
tara:strand:- start:900 stop:1400 length:501 start_codon:yes stop_codon:yes gene_type:complete